MIFYFDQLFTHVLPHLTEEIAGSLARLGHVDRPPIRFGTWVGGDRDGNPSVTPEVTMQVLELQHDHGLRNLIAAVEEVAEELSVSSRIRPIIGGPGSVPRRGPGSVADRLADDFGASTPTSRTD